MDGLCDWMFGPREGNRVTQPLGRPTARTDRLFLYSVRSDLSLCRRIWSFDRSIDRSTGGPSGRVVESAGRIMFKSLLRCIRRFFSRRSCKPRDETSRRTDHGANIDIEDALAEQLELQRLSGRVLSSTASIAGAVSTTSITRTCMETKTAGRRHCCPAGSSCSV